MFFFSPLMQEYYQDNNSKDTQPHGQNQEIDFSGRHIYSFSRLILLTRTMFLFPIRIKNECTNNYTNNTQRDEKNSNLIHFSSPLSIIYPTIEKIAKVIIPQKNVIKGIFSGVTNLPITTAAKTIWAKLNINLAKFSLRFLVSFIRNKIIQQIKTFVNKFFQTLVSHRVTGSLLLFCVLCGFSAFSAFTQEIDVKTKISAQQIGGSASGGKEWFAILTIPSKVEGLKDKDPAVRILAIQTSRKVEMVQFIHHGEQCRTKEG